jgi:hypothetical protein
MSLGKMVEEKNMSKKLQNLFSNQIGQKQNEYVKLDLSLSA